MKVELWFRGRPIVTKEKFWIDGNGKVRTERTIVAPATAITLPEDRITEHEQQTIDFLGQVAQSRMLPECFCQKRYGHRDHAEECPAKPR